ncbi:MAG TPA: hypothetical protein ENJ79_08375 [Gammaproteobacteria bacterium]|nr:hypothetical protein [Gammaproteobacteria bacterium]
MNPPYRSDPFHCMLHHFYHGGARKGGVHLALTPVFYFQSRHSWLQPYPATLGSAASFRHCDNSPCYACHESGKNNRCHSGEYRNPGGPIKLLKASTSQELARLAHTIACRVGRFLERQGLLCHYHGRKLSFGAFQHGWIWCRSARAGGSE